MKAGTVPGLVAWLSSMTTAHIQSSSKTDPGAESREVSEGVVIDHDADGNLTGIDIDNASRKLDLRELVTSHIPLANESA